jgi:NDP-sugar pyrophosphorylase family protein
MSAIHQLPAMVLTAGLGTRLQPLTSVRAKPAMPVAGDALVRRILGWLRGQRIADVVLNLHHKPGSIRAAVGDGPDLGLHISYSHEETLLGTAGGPRRALPLLGADRFFVVNGDTLTDVDLRALASEHARTGALVTMALVRNPDPAFYGGVIVDSSGCITGFAPRGPANHWYHFVGVQLVEASVFAALPVDRPTETIGDVYPRLIADARGSVRAFVCEAGFQDIGTPADYLVCALRIAALEGGPSRLIGQRCEVEAGARIARTILWDDVAVGTGAVLTECIVADGVRVPPGATISRAAIVRRADHLPRAGDESFHELVVARFAVKRAHEGILSDDAEAC